MAAEKKPAAQLPSSTPPLDFSKQINVSSLKDQSVLVTGGANGIGAGFVTALAQAGAYVTIVDIKEEQGKEIAAKLGSDGLRVQFVKADVRSFEEQNVAFKAAISFSKSSSIDIVIACAGLNGNSILNWLSNSETESESEELAPPNTMVIDVNLTGVFYTTHLALHHFRRTATSSPAVQSKQLIFVSSLAGYSTLPHTLDYQASKYGVRGFFRSIRGSKRVLGESGPRFRANLIAPTFVLTNMTAMLEPLLAAANIKMAKVEDCVDVMLRIASDEDVDGRAIAVAPEKTSFDLCDDFEGLDAGREFLAKLQSGIFGSGMAGLEKISARRKTAG